MKRFLFSIFFNVYKFIHNSAYTYIYMYLNTKDAREERNCILIYMCIYVYMYKNESWGRVLHGSNIIYFLFANLWAQQLGRSRARGWVCILRKKLSAKSATLSMIQKCIYIRCLCTYMQYMNIYILYSNGIICIYMDIRQRSWSKWMKLSAPR